MISDPMEEKRRYFHRRSICDARLEFNGLHSGETIVEATLLTAMGTLGICCGFACTSFSDIDDESKGEPMGHGEGISNDGSKEDGTHHAMQTINRGVADEIVTFTEQNLITLLNRHFPKFQHAPYPFHVDVQIIKSPLPNDLPPSETLSTAHPDHESHVDNANHMGLLMEAGIVILIGWEMRNGPCGMFGFGSKIISDTYSDEEIAFLIHLTDNAVITIQSLSFRHKIQTLQRDLADTTHRLENAEQDSEITKKNLEQTRFCLSGFNDIFDELSGLRESRAAIDAFLLVLLGIFSAKEGYIFHIDTDRNKGHISHRTLDGSVSHGNLPHGPHDSHNPYDILAEEILPLFDSTNPMKSMNPGPMQTILLLPEQRIHLPASMPTTAIALTYRVDETTMGLMGLGERITQSGYGTEERDLFTGFAKNFLLFFKNSKALETIRKLNQDQKIKSLALEKSIEEISAGRRTIEHLETLLDRIRSIVKLNLIQSEKTSFADILLILITGIVLGVVYNSATPTGISPLPNSWNRPATAHVNLEQVVSLHKSDKALFVDARPPEFFNQNHIPGAENLPPSLFDFIYMMSFSQLDPDRPIIVYGRNISRHYDEDTAFRLKERGHTNVFLFPGGLGTWEKQGLTTSDDLEPETNLEENPPQA